MRNTLILFALAAIVFASCESSKEQSGAEFSITAEFTGVSDSVGIFLQIMEENEYMTLDSAWLKDSKVHFNGVLESPKMVFLKIGETRKMVNFFAENSEILVKVNIDNLEAAEVTGSSVHDDFINFKTLMVPIEQRSESLNEAYREASMNGDSDRINEIIAESERIHSDQTDIIYRFIEDKSNSFIAPFVIRRYLVYELESEGLDSLLNKLSPDIHASEDYVFLSDRAETLRKVAVGQPAVDFALDDPSGNPVAISSFRGKFLLIDFWASWCRPCRVENPNVVKLYNDFNHKGFEIIGVSFDRDRDQWLAAIKDDHLTWTHVSDLQYWDSAAGKLYAINSIPATILLDRDGIIVAKNLRGDELRKKLEELYAAEGQNI
jgi:peroxiredoxin